MQGIAAESHPDHYFLESYLAKQQLAPVAADSFPFGLAYGYHFDSTLLGQFLAENASQKGVKRIYGDVVNVQTHVNGALASIELKDGNVINGDFFVDCTGFNSLLMQKTLKVNLISYKDSLVNNAAVVLPSKISDELPVETRSTALSSGWAWNIPLRDRFGNGYVYSKDFINTDIAETELRTHLGLLDSEVEARHLSMTVGRVEKHWHKNCLSVGLSQGFIEPLEATAIALSFNTVTQFIQCFEQGNGTEKFKQVFNQDINNRFDGIRDYIVCHYKMNQRGDNDYWRTCAANKNTSETLDKILYLWANSQDFIGDLNKYNLWGAYQPKSWACMLAGYGVFPTSKSREPKEPTYRPNELDGINDFIRRCGLNFQSHRKILEKQLNC